MNNDSVCKLDALRDAMKQEGIDGYIVPRIDKYQGEFVAPYAERLAWLTGFTGSAGVALVLKDKAAVLTDGRYTIQLNNQVDKSLYKTENIVKVSFAKWIAEEAAAGQVIGYDPWLHTPRQIESLRLALEEKSIRIKAIENNLIDGIWEDRPDEPSAPAELFPETVAGSSSAVKKDRITQILKEKKVFATILNMPDSLAWLLNVRGGDIESTPVVLSLGIVRAGNESVQWFVDSGKITPAVSKHLGNAVEIIEPSLIGKYIDVLAAAAKAADQPVGLDFAGAPVWFRQRLEAGGAKVVDLRDPTVQPKAIKTPSEQDSIREAHVKDGVAVVKFLAWLDEEAVKGKLTELDIVDKFEQIRREDPSYKGPSFSTISGFASNGAIVHYRAVPETNMKIVTPGLLLVDSGGQYHYGTTDITRTVAVGEASEEMKHNFTLVLKGHIALARAHFPEGTTGTQIDALARQPLWNENLDYAHGTGHGVGCYLSVHEEAASISTRGTEALKAGMLLSNEPGYYKEGEYGIRTENLVFVIEAGEGMLGFETITLAPIDRNLIKTDMLLPDERGWLNEYHARVLKTLSLKLDSKTKIWLERQTKPV